MWGRAIECGVLENPWSSPPEEPYTLTRNAKDAPAEPRDIVVGFDQGVPVSLDGKELDLVTLVDALGTAVGAYGWGRIDMVENRRVGIKSREVYECPASLALITAHQDLEGITLERDVAREKQRVEIRIAELIYDGLWHAPLMRALAAFVDETQRARDRRSAAAPRTRSLLRGRPARDAWLYDHDLATYDAEDTFRHEDSAGFVRLWGLSAETWSRRQGPGAGR